MTLLSTPSSSQKRTVAERRQQLMLGELPNDFLRVGGQSAQEVYDRQTALALQQRLAPALVSAWVPPNSLGRLNITIVQAKLAKNYGLVRMDPYCRVRVGNAVFETPTNHNGAKTPHWNRTIHAYLPKGIDSVYIEIFDERALTVDERIAWGHIVLPEAVFNHETIDDWFTLSGAQGEGKEGMINLVFSLSPLDAPPVAYVPLTQPVVMVPQHQYPIGQSQYFVTNQPGIPIPAGNADAASAIESGPLFTDEDVKELQEMFPNAEQQVIRSVLEEKCGNKDAAVNALLNITSE